MEERRPFEELCPQQWVTHFDGNTDMINLKFKPFQKDMKKWMKNFSKKPNLCKEQYSRDREKKYIIPFSNSALICATIYYIYS